VLGTVKRILNPDSFWYTACICNKAVIPDSRMFYYEKCNKHVSKVFPIGKSECRSKLYHVLQLQMNLEVEGVEPQRIWEMDLTHGHVNGRTVLVILT
jgi:hypothetical protein